MSSSPRSSSAGAGSMKPKASIPRFRPSDRIIAANEFRRFADQLRRALHRARGDASNFLLKLPKIQVELDSSDFRRHHMAAVQLCGVPGLQQALKDPKRAVQLYIDHYLSKIYGFSPLFHATAFLLRDDTQAMLILNRKERLELRGIAGRSRAVGDFGLDYAPRRWSEEIVPWLKRFAQTQFRTESDSQWALMEDRITACEMLADLIDPPQSSERNLTENLRFLLQGMLKLKAFDRESRKSKAAIVEAMLGLGTNVETFKQPMAYLVNIGLAESTTGRSGGCWLTKQGLKRAKKSS